ncbi:hypothetical protein Y1Q_0008895 [Alligator mississippiensis]|uniref:Uncharacterized protein n=1 Tax=Alligator mississippiensis TaxID=8496 RepID=A0A151MRP8_ALLMI|nr:hypothetical protein Y1Q_0008895 [Alligator mississippiensis]
MTQQSTLEETDVNFTEPEPGNAADKELDTDKCKQCPKVPARSQEGCKGLGRAKSQLRLQIGIHRSTRILPAHVAHEGSLLRGEGVARSQLQGSSGF